MWSGENSHQENHARMHDDTQAGSIAMFCEVVRIDLHGARSIVYYFAYIIYYQLQQLDYYSFSGVRVRYKGTYRQNRQSCWQYIASETAAFANTSCDCDAYIRRHNIMMINFFSTLHLNKFQNWTIVGACRHVVIDSAAHIHQIHYARYALTTYVRTYVHIGACICL